MANERITVGRNASEKGRIFRYSSSLFKNQNSINKEIKCRLKVGNLCYYSVQILYRLCDADSNLSEDNNFGLHVGLVPTQHCEEFLYLMICSGNSGLQRYNGKRGRNASSMVAASGPQWTYAWNQTWMPYGGEKIRHSKEHSLHNEELRNSYVSRIQGH